MTRRGDHVLQRTGFGPSDWVFPQVEAPDASGLVAVGADLEVSTLIEAYCSGLFPMPVGRKRVGWFSPDPRGVLELDHFKESRSLRRSQRRFRVTVDTAFSSVVQRCADPSRPHGWITESIQDAYVRLNREGFAHSVEAYNADDELVGGLYGVCIGSLFAGESMFHSETDASKVALAALITILAKKSNVLLDVQWVTPHLTSLGATAMERERYLERLTVAIAQPHTATWAGVDPDRSR